jgi:hypothetical protein
MLADVPLVVMATRWFRGIHPVTPEMDPRMRLVLLVSVVSYTALFALLLVVRKRQLALAEHVSALEERHDIVCCSLALNDVRNSR